MSGSLAELKGIRLAVEGCGHGTLHAIYASIEEACRQKGWPEIDLLIICGDFQSVRNAYDLNCVSMPAKYRDMCDFHEYYSGQRTAPYLTLFVGGNHEASNYLFELYHGGWVAPNIYYMGAANVLRLGPLRIAGLSGIWKGFDYRKPHHERLPYSESDIKSIYHVRELDVRKLLQIQTQVDIGISHDWPQGIEWEGNFKKLFNQKRHLEDDAKNGKLGSVAAKQMLDRIRPRFWFSAHLHCRYAAVVSHEQLDTSQKSLPKGNSNIVPLVTKNEDEIDLDMDDDEVGSPTATQPDPGGTATAAIVNEDEKAIEIGDNGGTSGASRKRSARDAFDPLAEARNAPPSSSAPSRVQEPRDIPLGITNSETRFLALDKCLPNRHFLQLISVPTEVMLDTQRPLKLEYDREWLAITRAFHLSERPVFGDPDERVPHAKSQSEYQHLIEEQHQWVDVHLDDDALIIPRNFEVTAPIYDGGHFQNPEYRNVREFPNPQTACFCRMLHIDNSLEISEAERDQRLAVGPRTEDGQLSCGAGVRGRSDRGRGRSRGGRRGRGRGGYVTRGH